MSIVNLFNFSSNLSISSEYSLSQHIGILILELSFFVSSSNFKFSILFLSSISNINAEVKRIISGNENAKITIIAYESLTCSHCANFHKEIYPKLKNDYIDTGLVKIEFRHFPLDIAALNAAKISQCRQDKSLEILERLYSNQQGWVKGSSFEEVNENLKKFLYEKIISLGTAACPPYHLAIVIGGTSAELNLKTVKLKDGSEVSVGKKFHAAAYADKKAEAIQWLRSNGLGDIVKNEITVNFGQSEDNKAIAYANLAREHGYEPSQKETVHHASLSVVMREWKEKGNEIPSDLFSVLDADKAKITGKS